jgi:hypothetical protein
MSIIISNNQILMDVAYFKSKMSQHNFIFSYRGKISYSISKKLLSITEKKIDSLKEEDPIKKKIFGVMINCLETICSPEKSANESQESIFMIGKSNNGYSIYTGVSMENNNTESLKKSLEHINQLSGESLSELRKEKLLDIKQLNETFNLDEATLGLINIAKKSGQKLNYLFEELENNKSFFSLQVFIN